MSRGILIYTCVCRYTYLQIYIQTIKYFQMCCTYDNTDTNIYRYTYLQTHIQTIKYLEMYCSYLYLEIFDCYTISHIYTDHQISLDVYCSYLQSVQGLGFSVQGLGRVQCQEFRFVYTDHQISLDLFFISLECVEFRIQCLGFRQGLVSRVQVCFIGNHSSTWLRVQDVCVCVCVCVCVRVCVLR